MLAHDARGVTMTVGRGDSVLPYEAALEDVLLYRGDPIGRIEAALLEDPALVMGHLLRAHILLFALQPSFRDKAIASLHMAEALVPGATERERLHLAAARSWLAGDLAGACEVFDRLLREHPRDLAALMFAHQADFFTARTADLLHRPARALRAWSADMPGRSHVEAMLAFGLEEAGAYAPAEALGRAVVAANPRDVWAIHAVGHVLEMQGRDEEGIAWYREREADWAPESFFAVHNAWHLALYHVDLDDPAGALAVYDRMLRPGRRSILLNLCDAASLLWRLRLAGVEAGDRWGELAALTARHALSRLHVFDDIHMAMALAGAGDPAFGQLRESLERSVDGSGEYAARVRQIVLPVSRALAAFVACDHAAAADLLLAARPHFALMCGSHAQREVLDLTLVEAAIRSGRHSLARALLAPRLARKPASRSVRRDLARCR